VRGEGRRWYINAQKHADYIAFATGLSRTQAAGVVAALSPQKSWTENVRIARLVAQHKWGHHTRAQEWAACRIMLGEDPTSVLRGPKTRAFYWSIIAPHHTHREWGCVDRHMLKLAGLQPSPRATQVCQRALTILARMSNESIPTVQAALWLVQRFAGRHQRLLPL